MPETNKRSHGKSISSNFKKSSRDIKDVIFRFNKLFYLLGFLAPVLIKEKIFLQKLCQLKIE